MAAQGVKADVAGRPKHIYSIWKKMRRKEVPISELYDLRAVRVLVDDIGACYAALGVVHATWVPIPSEFDDYIARPKRNDYRSLHTAVIGPEGKTLEVQIRTFDMHRQAELGVAAHWKYKEAGSHSADAAFDRKIAWMRRLLEAHGESGESGEGGAALSGEFDSELVEDRIYVLTPKGEVMDLPAGATPLDFAYHVHTQVGHRCRGAKVDGRIVPLDYKLHSGDRVEILTGKTAEPRRDWLIASNGFLASSRSREKVRTWFHKLDRARNEQEGKELLDKELRRLGLLGADLTPTHERFNVSSDGDLYVLVALGDVGPHQVGRVLLELERAANAPTEADAAITVSRAPRKVDRRSAEFTVEGVGNLLVQLARCCQPVADEPIVGYLTRGRGVSVHRPDCPSYLRLAAAQPQRVLPVEWGSKGGGYEVDVEVLALDRKWLLKEVSNVIAQANAHVSSISSQLERNGARVRLRARLRVTRLRSAVDPARQTGGIARCRERPPLLNAVQAALSSSSRYARFDGIFQTPRQPGSTRAHRRDPALGRFDELNFARTPNRARRAPIGGRAWNWRWIVIAAVIVIALLLLLRQPLADWLWPETRAHSCAQQAAQALAAGRLTATDGTGARELYEAALALDPDRIDAREGLNRVGQAALAQARSAMARRQYRTGPCKRWRWPGAVDPACADRSHARAVAPHEAACVGLDDLLSEGRGSTQRRAARWRRQRGAAAVPARARAAARPHAGARRP